MRSYFEMDYNTDHVASACLSRLVDFLSRSEGSLAGPAAALHQQVDGIDFDLVEQEGKKVDIVAHYLHGLRVLLLFWVILVS